MNYFFVGIGGALGAMSRYFLQGVVQRLSSHNFPSGTLAVNILGCFILGFIIAFDSQRFVSSSFKSFAIFGVLGGFTTFSAFSFETFAYIKTGEIILASVYILGSIVLSLIGIWCGHIIGKLI